MKTWRVSLTYRVKSAHKVKLTDKQLLQWMVPILLVMGIYLGTWTAAEPPSANEVNYRNERRKNFFNNLFIYFIRSPISKDCCSNNARLIGGIMRWQLARFYFSYGEFVFATTFEMPSHCTMRRN
jgi:hypothetical protein